MSGRRAHRHDRPNKAFAAMLFAVIRQWSYTGETAQQIILDAPDIGCLQTLGPRTAASTRSVFASCPGGHGKIPCLARIDYGKPHAANSLASRVFKPPVASITISLEDTSVRRWQISAMATYRFFPAGSSRRSKVFLETSMPTHVFICFSPILIPNPCKKKRAYWPKQSFGLSVRYGVTLLAFVRDWCPQGMTSRRIETKTPSALHII